MEVGAAGAGMQAWCTGMRDGHPPSAAAISRASNVTIFYGVPLPQRPGRVATWLVFCAFSSPTIRECMAVPGPGQMAEVPEVGWKLRLAPGPHRHSFTEMTLSPPEGRGDRLHWLDWLLTLSRVKGRDLQGQRFHQNQPSMLALVISRLCSKRGARSRVICTASGKTDNSLLLGGLKAPWWCVITSIRK